MAECRFRPPKTSEEEEKCVASAIPRSEVCSIVESEPKHEVAIIEREFKF
ncbi:unnamed protein product, partial [Porites lobata]